MLNKSLLLIRYEKSGTTVPDAMQSAKVEPVGVVGTGCVVVWRSSLNRQQICFILACHHVRQRFMLSSNSWYNLLVRSCYLNVSFFANKKCDSQSLLYLCDIWGLWLRLNTDMTTWYHPLQYMSRLSCMLLWCTLACDVKLCCHNRGLIPNLSLSFYCFDYAHQLANDKRLTRARNTTKN